MKRTKLLSGLIAGLVGCAVVNNAAADLYVSSDAASITRRYDEVTGNYIANFATSAGGAGAQFAVHFGATNGRVLIGNAFGGVGEYDSTTGSFIRNINPGGGWQWAGIYAPNGNIFIGDLATNDVREYDFATGNYVQTLTTGIAPADMTYGPNGNLYIAGYSDQKVREVDPSTGNTVNEWITPANTWPNDIAFLPNGEILVTVMDAQITGGPDGNKVLRYSPTFSLLGDFAGTGWMRTHGIDISPVDGNIYVADGVTNQVHVFDANTFAEIDQAFLNPTSQSKLIDPVFYTVPEPTTMLLLGLGGGLMLFRHRRGR